MRIIQLLLVVALFSYISIINAQSNYKDEVALISETLTDYIEGSINGQPNRLKKVFHEDLNLYYIEEGQLKTWSGELYIKDTKEGKSTGEKGKIISIDFENDIAVVKVQFAHPGKTPYVGYFMLMKLEDGWKIIHKMFTKRTR